MKERNEGYMRLRGWDAACKEDCGIRETWGSVSGVKHGMMDGEWGMMMEGEGSANTLPGFILHTKWTVCQHVMECFTEYSNVTPTSSIRRGSSDPDSDSRSGTSTSKADGAERPCWHRHRRAGDVRTRRHLMNAFSRRCIQ